MLWGLINGLHQVRISMVGPDPTKRQVLSGMCKPGSVPGLSFTAEQHSPMKSWIPHFHVFPSLQVTYRNEETQILTHVLL